MSESREEDRKPDMTEDPRKAETGQGYGEENPAGGQEPDGPEADEDRESHGAATGDGEDSSPGSATGNPDAAGG